FSVDIKRSKEFLTSSPEVAVELNSFPSSQWERILRGQAVDLDQILSGLHGVQLAQVGKARIRNSQVDLSTPEPRRTVQTSTDWSVAFRKAADATSFIFEHRTVKLLLYAQYIESLFAAKIPASHGRVILYDKAVRSHVGGGHNISLTDYHKFSTL
ncbi:hypothetical protein CPB83DRAFT_788099, partial [Crepidotus variabilis]